MRENLTRVAGNLHRAFNGFTAGQKVVAVIGTAALLLAGFMVFRWAATPSYAPLFSNLASSDASAVIEELDAQGVPYRLSNGGNTIMVPREDVYSTRIALSGEGLPTASESGYSLLDDQGLSTSQFQEHTDFKRAMEGELSRTIEAIDGVETAVVHLAMPPRQVFADEQDPTTASVLVRTRAGSTLNPEQVQAVVNLVASSVDGLKEDQVTVADATGKVLSAPGSSAVGSAQSQTQQVVDFQNRMTTQVQSLLDRVVGPGNSAVQITANLSFDKTVSETVRYFGNADTALSESETSEILTGDAAAGTEADGVVGPQGQTEARGTRSGASSYEKNSRTADNAVNKTVETREAAPGGVASLHAGIVLDTRALAGQDPADIQNLVTAALGIDPDRGDTVEVASLPFDRTAEALAAKELEDAEEAADQARTLTWVRNGGLVLLVALLALAAWIQSRRRAKARMEATSYVVEQLRQDAIDRAAAKQAELEAVNHAQLALEAAEHDEQRGIRDEIAALVERQPEDVAALLRGWLVEKS